MEVEMIDKNMEAVLNEYVSFEDTQLINSELTDNIICDTRDFFIMQWLMSENNKKLVENAINKFKKNDIMFQDCIFKTDEIKSYLKSLKDVSDKYLIDTGEYANETPDWRCLTFDIHDATYFDGWYKYILFHKIGDDAWFAYIDEDKIYPISKSIINSNNIIKDVL